MEENKVDMFLMANGKYFESIQIPMIRDQLLKLDDGKWTMLQSLNLKNPTTLLIVSLLAGQLGIDRFMVGDTGLGIAKLLTCGGLGIWTIVDWFLIQGITRKKNYEKLQQFAY
ncbi:MAG: TM2 domain-containing protein [Bacteroidetes bacterium]|nr:MAG: TM2 domain-containing protein [Bacteroidota bacterium]